MRSIEETKVYSEIFTNLTPVLISYALDNKNKLKDGFIPFLQFMDTYCSSRGKINYINMGVLGMYQEDDIKILDNKLNQWLALWALDPLSYLELEK